MFWKKKRDEAPPIGIVLHCNLDWPTEPVRTWSIGRRDDLYRNSLELIATQERCWWEAGLILQHTDSPQLAVDESGQELSLTVPVLLERAGQPFWVFPYPLVDDESAGHFLSVQQAAARSRATAVYYAPEPLPLVDAAPTPLFNPFELALRSLRNGEALSADDYAMWWPEHAADRISGSDFGDLLDRIYVLQDRYGSFLGGVLRARMVPGSTQSSMLRVFFPPSVIFFEVIGPGELPMQVSVCQEKGLRFHFPVRGSTRSQRLALLRVMERHLAALGVRAEADGLQNDAELLGPDDGSPGAWWAALRRFADQRLTEQDWQGFRVGQVLNLPPES
jgi:hypothetical protein